MIQNKYFLFLMSFMSILALYCPDAFSKTKKTVISRAAATQSQTKSVTLKVCKAGQYLPAHSVFCSSCRDRYYCPGGTFEIKSFDQGLKNCINSSPNAARTACVVSCKAGQYLPANISSCSPCRDRYYCPGGIFTTGTNTYNQGLKSCLYNTVPNDTRTACINQNAKKYTCAAGQYLPGKATNCSNCKDRYYACAGGTFNQSPVAQGLLRCATGQIADSTKTQCIYDTYTCSAGQYLPAKSTKCTSCKKDYYCAGGNYTYSSINQGLAQCPAGFHPNKAKTECEKDLPNEVTCGAGFYLPANTMECKRCSDSKRYCPGGKTFKKSDIDQGIFACPMTSIANDDKSACVLTLSKTFIQYGPNETAPLSEQCWAYTDSVKYKTCLFGNQVVLPEDASTLKEE